MENFNCSIFYHTTLGHSLNTFCHSLSRRYLMSLLLGNLGLKLEYVVWRVYTRNQKTQLRHQLINYLQIIPCMVFPLFAFLWREFSNKIVCEILNLWFYNYVNLSLIWDTLIFFFSIQSNLNCYWTPIHVPNASQSQNPKHQNLGQRKVYWSRSCQPRRWET